MSKNIEWKKSEINYDELNELSHKQLVIQNIGKHNAESGLLKKISKSGGKATGKKNVESGHMDRLNKSLTTKQRRKNKTIIIPLEDILKAQEGEFSSNTISKKLNIAQLTYRNLCKKYGIPNKFEPPKLDCSYCGKKNLDKGNFTKYHGDNCKQKPTQ